jgi:hypothetical protein
LESRVGDRARTLQTGEGKGDGEVERRAGGKGGLGRVGVRAGKRLASNIYIYILKPTSFIDAATLPADLNDAKS